MESGPGRLIGNYRDGRLLGQGGMGALYSAEHAALRLPSALKVFTADGAKRDFLRKRFLAEGWLLASDFTALNSGAKTLAEVGKHARRLAETAETLELSATLLAGAIRLFERAGEEAHAGEARQRLED